MSRADTNRHALARAALVSLLLHLLAVPLFAVTGAPPGAGTARDDAAANESTRVAYLSIEVRPARRRAHAGRGALSKGAARAKVSPPQRPVAHAPHRRALAKLPRRASDSATPAANEAMLAASETGAARRRSAAAATRPYHIARPALALTLATAPPERSVTPEPPPPTASRNADTGRAADIASTKVGPPATQPPTEAPPAIVAARAGDSPPGGWGQSFAKPLVADESVLATLHEKYPGIRAISVEVDASGHATHVTIPESVTGEARSDLARALLAVRYVPAECNGLRCTGTLQLAL